VETSRFLRSVGGFPRIEPNVTGAADGEKRFHEYPGSAADFLTAAGNGLLFLYHVVADGTCTMALSWVFVNEMGISSGLILVTGNPPASERDQVSERPAELKGFMGR
jgi:hypothetical protein